MSITHPYVKYSNYEVRTRQTKRVLNDFVDEINISSIIMDYTIQMNDFELKDYPVRQLNYDMEKLKQTITEHLTQKKKIKSVKIDLIRDVLFTLKPFGVYPKYYEWNYNKRGLLKLICEMIYIAEINHDTLTDDVEYNKIFKGSFNALNDCIASV